MPSWLASAALTWSCASSAPLSIVARASASTTPASLAAASIVSAAGGPRLNLAPLSRAHVARAAADRGPGEREIDSRLPGRGLDSLRRRRPEAEHRVVERRVLALLGGGERHPRSVEALGPQDRILADDHLEIGIGGDQRV